VLRRYSRVGLLIGLTRVIKTSGRACATVCTVVGFPWLASQSKDAACACSLLLTVAHQERLSPMSRRRQCGLLCFVTEGLTSVANAAPALTRTLLSNKILRCAELRCQQDAHLDGPDCFLVSVVVSLMAAAAQRRKLPGAVGASRSRRIRIPSIRYLLVLASQLTAC
jgi:hypothetical protein